MVGACQGTSNRLHRHDFPGCRTRASGGAGLLQSCRDRTGHSRRALLCSYSAVLRTLTGQTDSSCPSPGPGPGPGPIPTGDPPGAGVDSGLWALGSGYWHRPRCQFGIACPQSLTPGPCRSQGTIDHTFTPTRVKASRLSQAPAAPCSLPPLFYSCSMLGPPVRHSLMPQLRRCFQQLLETSSLSGRLSLDLSQPSPLFTSISNASVSFLLLTAIQTCRASRPVAAKSGPGHECESSHSSTSGAVLAGIGGGGG